MHDRSAGPQASAASRVPRSASARLDPREVAHFNSQAETERGESARLWLHRYNPLRLAFVEHAAQAAGLISTGNGLRGLSILDVGCGTGIFCEALAGCGAQVRGLDPANSAITLARSRARPELRLAYSSGLVSDASEMFDIVTAMEVLEHVPDAATFLHDCAARVRPGGLLVVSTINRTWSSYAFAIVMAEYVLRLLPRGAHAWRRFVQPREVEGVLNGLGFQPLACWGATMDLRTRLMKRSSSPAVNYLMAARRPPQIRHPSV